MTFPAELERLLKEATPKPWYLAGCNTVHGSDHEEVAHPFNLQGDAELIVLLRNHADAILGLVRAAEYYANEYRIADEAGEIGFWPENEAKHCKALFDALAKLNGEGK